MFLELSGAILTDHPLAHCGLANALHIDAPAVVLDADHHLALLIGGAQQQGAYLRFARRPALFGSLQTVIETVAQKVHERVTQHL